MKRFILSIGLAASAAFAYANPVSVQTAQTVATNFIVSRGVGSNPSLQLTKSYTSTEASGQTSMYVFDVNNGKGFVIVSGDDAVMPILGYSTENIFPQQVTNNEVAYWMNGYNEQISNVIAHHVVASAAISADWSALINNTIEDNHTAAKPTDVAPMITTTWDQMNPFSSTGNSLYNNFCPTSTPTGCVATAMAQVMNFWQHPATGTGSHTYNSSTQGGTLTANFDTAYDWANMPAQLHNNSSATQKKAIALLMYNCGVAVEMDYDFADNGGSGAIVINYGSTTLPCSQNALKNYFGYSADIKGLKRSSYPVDSVWISKLRAELDAGRPLIYTGQGSVGGHAFDFDGYQTSTNMFHVNWGWSGNSNGYFTINNLAPPALGVGGGGGNFNSSQEALISIHPAAIEPNLVTNTGLTASQTSIAPGAAFTVTTTIKNTGTGDLTNGSLVGGVYDANGTTIVGYMQILSNQSLVAGATMPVTFSTTGISAMVPGNYIVRALYKENASDATWTIVGNGTSPNNVTIHVTDPTGINQLDDASMMKIFPNPANDLVTIDWGKFSGNVTGVQLFNILGQEVFHTETLTGTNIEIPVSNLSAGNYSMRIVTDKGTFAKKIAVK